MVRTLLLVDDELSVLRSLQRLFRPAGYRILTALSGSEALALMAQQSVHVVLSDFRMPRMTGDKLLREVRQLYPGTVRVILSGFAELNAVMAALNDGVVYKFLVKPWDNAELLAHMEDAFSYWAALQRELAACRLMNSSQEYFFDLDEAGTVVQLTPLAAQLCEVEVSQAIGCQLSELLPALSPDQLQQLLNHDQQTLIFNDVFGADWGVQCRKSIRGHYTVQLLRRETVHGWALGLTGLYDRCQGLAVLQKQLDARQRIVVICLTLERYDSFKETLSYSHLDLLLSALASRLLALPVCHQLIMVSEGEFLLVAGSVTDSQAHHLIEQVQGLFDQPVHFADRETFVSFYSGYAMALDDGDQAEQLAQNAHTAARHARNRGRYFYPRYRNSMQRDSSDQLELQNDLYRALERNQLHIEYQPKVAIDTGRILGAEALLRWQHHSRGRVPPAIFIPLAESNGLIDPIGEWVLCAAVTQSRFWQQEGMANFTIAVNLSGRQLRQQQRLVDQVRDTLRQTGMPARNLELEVTETFLMEDIEENLALLSDLKQLGIKLAIDDFGTGYSSLAYLDQMPADTLKLDISFIRKLPHEADTVALVGRMIEMAHSLGMSVVAEGVEQSGQRQILQQMGCDQIQGFLFSRPVSASSFRTLLSAQPLVAKAVEPQFEPG